MRVLYRSCQFTSSSDKLRPCWTSQSQSQPTKRTRGRLVSYIEELAKRDAPVLMALNEDQLYLELARVSESLNETPQAEKSGYADLTLRAVLHAEDEKDRTTGQYDKGLDYYEKALAISLELGDRTREGSALSSLGNVFYQWGQYDKAVDCYEKSLAICREVNDRIGEAKSLVCLGNVFYQWGQYDKAVDYYEKSLAICREVNDQKGEVYALNNLSLLSTACGWKDRAEEHYEKAVQIARNLVVPLGDESRLRAFGQRLFNKVQREAYELICGSEAESVKQRESLLQSFGIKNETALIACFTSILVPYFGMAAPVAVVIATLLAKSLLKTTYETLCEAWESSLS